MIYVIIFFLLVSVFFYVLFGGADFGAGIVELFSKSKESTTKLITNAMLPIWEANHMWLIIAVVILFNAFPPLYTQISIALYIPLIILLLGIVLRGTAFTFRHYDAFKDYSNVIYTRIFMYSSLLVSIMFGLIIGALVSGKIYVQPMDFYSAYVHPWLNLFSISIGIFVAAIFAFVASVYLIGDTTDFEIRIEFIQKSKKANIVMVIAGALVFISSFIEDVDFASRFFSNIGSILMIIVSTVLLPVLWITLSKGKIWLSRIITGAQLFAIIGAFYLVYFPTVVKMKDANDLTLFNSAAPDITLKYLGYALIVGSFIIFPSLIYLIKVFKVEPVKEIPIEDRPVK
ncbi:MAG TPA: cytochrome d ubiquinol oxidase subunit II [Ignavibacteriaceae bacterium]|nr:cytochrome d ubiquinol oxidase subunit II [Ignavibacteriaceae bacterium]